MRSIRSLALALALTSLAPLAHAGGAMIDVNRSKDGTYLAHAYACTGPASMTVTATAEGVANGERKSIPLKLTRLKDPGVYRFERTWPGDGTWLVRAEMSGSRQMVAIFTIARDGRVIGNEYVAEGDGRERCDQKLAAMTK